MGPFYLVVFVFTTIEKEGTILDNDEIILGLRHVSYCIILNHDDL